MHLMAPWTTEPRGALARWVLLLELSTVGSHSVVKEQKRNSNFKWGWPVHGHIGSAEKNHHYYNNKATIPCCCKPGRARKSKSRRVAVARRDVEWR